MFAHLRVQHGIFHGGAGEVRIGLDELQTLRREKIRPVAVGRKCTEGFIAPYQRERHARTYALGLRRVAPRCHAWIGGDVGCRLDPAGTDGTAGRPLPRRRVIPAHLEALHVGIVRREIRHRPDLPVRIGATEPGDARAETLYAGAGDVLAQGAHIQRARQVLRTGVKYLQHLDLFLHALLGTPAYRKLMAQYQVQQQRGNGDECQALGGLQARQQRWIGDEPDQRPVRKCDPQGGEQQIQQGDAQGGVGRAHFHVAPPGGVKASPRCGRNNEGASWITAMKSLLDGPGWRPGGPLFFDAVAGIARQCRWKESPAGESNVPFVPRRS